MFIHDDFLLHSSLAVELYQEVKDLPIIDFHNHLSPKEIYENMPFDNISRAWLAGDHYKWRLMRNSGIDEEIITNPQDLKRQFVAYAQSLEKAFLNPLYHWSHMELKQYFHISDTLNVSNAESIYNQANEFLKEIKKGPREFLQDMNVEALCTTDDINDDLKYHKLIKEDDSFKIKVLPTFRPDRLFSFDTPLFLAVLSELTEITGVPVNSISSLKNALDRRLVYFQENGCKVADHGLATISYSKVNESLANRILQDRINGLAVSSTDINKLNLYLLKHLTSWYKKHQWTMQIHFGATRNNNRLMFEKLGKDSGFDSIGDQTFVDDLNKLLSEMEYASGLPRLIIYNLNPRDNEALASLCGNFSKDVPGKVQFGPAWWFNDHFAGIINHLEVFSTYLNLSHFIGMLTDSRSFLSFVRHDYFRRILVNFIAEKVSLGLIPEYKKLLFELVSNISYYNCKVFLNL